MGSQMPESAPAPGGSSPTQCSVGIMAYNEASNIANAISSILSQSSGACNLREIIIVASGCTDDTVPIVAELSRSEPRVRVVVQERREGKASAINVFLAEAKSPILIMVSADVILKDGALAMLLSHFQDEKVGMVGAHPVPVNDDRRFLGHTVKLLWELHDRVARESPKLGEVVAFRNVVPSIPSDTPVDEISIQALVTQLGYRLVYEPGAIVYNRGPTTVSDFIRQRRRIYSGHLRIQQQQRYSASTMSVSRVFRALLSAQPFSTPRSTVYTIGAVGLEATARMLGGYDYVRRRQHYLWQISTTTKSQITEVASATSWQSVLVFHIVNFHQHEIELGGRGVQQVLQHLIALIRQRLGADGSVAQGRSGTIIVSVQLDREAAEELGRTLLGDITASAPHVNGRVEETPVEVACGIIAFPQAGIALATSIIAPA